MRPESDSQKTLPAIGRIQWLARLVPALDASMHRPCRGRDATASAVRINVAVVKWKTVSAPPLFPSWERASLDFVEIIVGIRHGFSNSVVSINFIILRRNISYYAPEDNNNVERLSERLRWKDRTGQGGIKGLSLTIHRDFFCRLRLGCAGNKSWANN